MNSTLSARTPALDAESIRTYRHLQGQINPRMLERFKAVTELGCIPLHLSRTKKNRRGVPVLVSACESGHHPLRHLALPEEIRRRAGAIAIEENRKLEAQGVATGWVDGEKLAVHQLDTFDTHVCLAVESIRWSEILALKGRFFEEIAGLRAFKLDTNNHVTGKDKGREVLLIAKRGRMPGNRLMGSEVLHAPVEGAPQLTLASNGTVDADIAKSHPPALVWAVNSFKEMREEVGRIARNLRYLGIMVDPHVFVGAVGIVGLIKTNLSPKSIIDAKTKARDGCEIEDFDVVAMEKQALAAYMAKNLHLMLPQLVTGLVMLGYRRWGEDFLRAADR